MCSDKGRLAGGRTDRSHLYICTVSQSFELDHVSPYLEVSVRERREAGRFRWRLGLTACQSEARCALKFVLERPI
jgi:hypothetical protein